MYKKGLRVICIYLAIAAMVGMLLVGTVSAMASDNKPTLTKVSDVCEDCVNRGDEITYTICYSNPASFKITEVKLIDTLPEETEFLVASDEGVYNETYHTVTWNIGTLAAYTGEACVTVTVTVKPGTAAGSMINNTATLSYNVLLTYRATKTASDETEICVTEIPEFTSIALPVAAILGLIVFFNHRKRSYR